MTPTIHPVSASAFSSASAVAFPPFEKGGQGGFALNTSLSKKKQIPLYPPFSKGQNA